MDLGEQGSKALFVLGSKEPDSLLLGSMKLG